MVLAAGADILGDSQGVFDNGFWIIKDRDNNSTQFQLVDSVRGQDGDGDWQAINCPGLATQDYDIPGGNSVAWCWSAPNAWASTDADVTAGTLASNGRRNLVLLLSLF